MTAAPWQAWLVVPGVTYADLVATCATEAGAERVARREVAGGRRSVRAVVSGHDRCRWFARVNDGVTEISGQGLVFRPATAQDLYMTTTTNQQILGTRKGYCHSCSVRRTGPSQDARGCDLCDRCLTEAELENEHSDYGHDEPVKGCPTCGLGSDLTVTRTQSVSTIDKTGTCVCGRCHHELPTTKFPTITAKGIRETECRECRDYRVAGRRIGRPSTVVRPMDRKQAKAFMVAAHKAEVVS